MYETPGKSTKEAPNGPNSQSPPRLLICDIHLSAKVQEAHSGHFRYHTLGGIWQSNETDNRMSFGTYLGRHCIDM